MEANRPPFAIHAGDAAFPTAALAQEYLARPNATRAWLFLRGSRRSPPSHTPDTRPGLRGGHLRALDRAPRLTSADPRLPALGRWQAARIAHERRHGPTPTRHGSARRRDERARPTPPVVPPPSIRPEPLVVEVPIHDGARPWRGRYGLIVIDGEVLLYPQNATSDTFRFRAYAGREAVDPAPVPRDERPIDAALRRLAADLQAQLDRSAGDTAR